MLNMIEAIAQGAIADQPRHFSHDISVMTFQP
jgi:hypothetical protein